jgi:hypothetical protein
MIGAGAFQLLNGKFTDGGTAETIYIPVPHRCRVTKIQASIEGAVGSVATLITAKIGGTAVTGGVVTLPVAASAAGDVEEAVPTALNNLEAGEALELECNGGSDAMGSVMVTVQIDAQKDGP